MDKIIAFRPLPRNVPVLRTGFEINAIEDRVSKIIGIPFEIRKIDAARKLDLQHHINKFKPELIHFSGHGSREGELVFEDERGEAQVISPEALEAVFSVLSCPVKCVLLNLCYSSIQAMAIAKYVGCVIGMSAKVPDEIAIVFSRAFYSAVAHNMSIGKAFKQGVAEMKLYGATSDILPVLLPVNSECADNLYINFGPKLVAEFVINDGEIELDGDDYSIIISIVDQPEDAVEVIYQFNDKTYNKPFTKRKNVSRRFQFEFETYGDFEIRATIWRADGSGIGISRYVSDALADFYGENPRKRFKTAIKAIKRE